MSWGASSGDEKRRRAGRACADGVRRLGIAASLLGAFAVLAACGARAPLRGAGDDSRDAQASDARDALAGEADAAPPTPEDAAFPDAGCLTSVEFSPVQLANWPGPTECSYENPLAVGVFREGELVAQKVAPCLDPFEFGQLPAGRYEVAAAYPYYDDFVPMWGVGMQLILPELGDDLPPCGSDIWCSPLKVDVQGCNSVTVPLVLYCSPQVTDGCNGLAARIREGNGARRNVEGERK